MNFKKIVEEKLSYIKDNYFNEKDKQLNTKKDKKEDDNKSNINNNSNNKDKIKDIKKPKNKEYSKRFKILKECLMILKYNEISLEEFIKNNPFQSQPFQLNDSFEFIEAVKYEKLKEIEKFLKKNINLLYSYDYYRQTGFHWAAKKNNINALKLMLKYGNCVNQIDINHMTPLAFSAKNNNIEMCQLLCENGANPFIPNKDDKIPIDLTTEFKIKSFLINWGDNYSKQKKY